MRTRCLWPAALVVLAVMAATMVFVSPAMAESADESLVLALTNGTRASAGSPALNLDEKVSAVSRAWARKMASDGNISHNPSYGDQISGWSKVGENVGMGGNVDVVHRALVASPGHYANLISADFTLAGIGVVNVGGAVFVVQNFVRPRSPVVHAQASAPAASEPPAPRRPAVTVPPRRSPPPAPSPPPAAAEPVPEPVPAPATEAASPALNFVLDALRAFDQSVHR